MHWGVGKWDIVAHGRMETRAAEGESGVRGQQGSKAARQQAAGSKAARQVPSPQATGCSLQAKEVYCHDNPRDLDNFVICDQGITTATARLRIVYCKGKMLFLQFMRG
jgi:type IV secretory pathway TrbL component